MDLLSSWELVQVRLLIQLHFQKIHWDLGSFTSKTIADLRTALMSAATSIGDGNTGYVYFSANFSSVVSGWATTTTTLTAGGYCTVRISNVMKNSNGYFHGTIYNYDVPEYTFSVINGAWSALNRNLVQSDYDTLATNDNAKFKSVSASNDTLTFTNGSGTTTSVTVDNVANATNATDASYTTTQAATDNSTKIASTAFVQNAIPQISILTGVCNDGETIPLPAGYTEGQCKIFVSMNTENPNGYWFDVVTTSVS